MRSSRTRTVGAFVNIKLTHLIASATCGILLAVFFASGSSASTRCGNGVGQQAALCAAKTSSIETSPAPRCATNAAQTAAAATHSALRALTHNGIGRLVASGYLDFSFAAKTCGGYQVSLSILDPRPSKRPYASAAGYARLGDYLGKLRVGKLRNVQAALTDRGKRILRYAYTHHLDIHTLVVTHVQPASSDASIEVMNAAVLKSDPRSHEGDTG